MLKYSAKFEQKKYQGNREYMPIFSFHCSQNSKNIHTRNLTFNMYQEKDNFLNSRTGGGLSEFQNTHIFNLLTLSTTYCDGNTLFSEQILALVHVPGPEK